MNMLRHGCFLVCVCRNSLKDKCLQGEASYVLYEASASADTTKMLYGNLFKILSACLTFFFLPHPCPHLVWTDWNFFANLWAVKNISFLVVICAFLIATVLGRVIYTFWMLILCGFKFMANISPAREVFLILFLVSLDFLKFRNLI